MDQYFRPVIQIMYFLLVLVVKIQLSNQQYFQISASLTISALSLPVQLMIKSQMEETQFAVQFFYRSINILCLGCLDLALKDEIFLQCVQYVIMGRTLAYYLEIDETSSLQRQHRVARLVFLISLIVAMNLTSALYNGGVFGSVSCNALLAMWVIQQGYIEFQQSYMTKSNKSNKSFKKKGMKSLTDKVETPRRSEVSDYHDESYQMGLQVLSGPGIRDNSSVYSKLESQKNFHKQLFHEFPEGMVIISELGKIEYHNRQIKTWFGTGNREIILGKLKQLRNYSKKFKEQAQFSQLFQSLNQRLRKKSQEQVLNCPQDGHNTDSSDAIEPDEMLPTQLSNAEFLSEEIDRGIDYFKDPDIQPQSISLARDNSIHSLKMHDPLRFLYEVQMLCVLREHKEDACQSSQQLQEEVESDQLIHVTLKPYSYDGKSALLLMIRDVSVFNQYKVMQQINQNKSKMLQSVAHELRTPLQVIGIISQQLIDQFVLKDRPFTEKYLMPLISSSNQIEALVKDLLDLAQLRAGKFKLSHKEFPLEKMLFELATMMTFQIHQKKLSLTLEYDQRIQPQIKSDQDRIRQIIINLIGNSSKFTQSGGITVSAKYISKKQTEISVSDTGRGIKSEDIPKLFKAFGKLDDTSKINPQGVGLGLQISNILAQKISGDGEGLSVQSEGLGKGSKFSFIILDQSGDQQLTSTDSGIKQFGRKESAMNIVYIASNNTHEPTSASKFKPKVVGIKSEKLIDIDPEPTVKTYHFQVSDSLQEQSDYMKNYYNLIDRSASQLNSVRKEHERDPILPIIQRFDDDSPRIMSVCRCEKILIVDDQPINAQVIAIILDKISIKYHISYSGQQAIQYLEQRQPTSCCPWIKIILMDVEMPGLSGQDTTRQIRKLEQSNGQKAQIIGISGHQGDDIMDECIKAGMDSYMVKPIKQPAFIKTLQAMI